MTLKYIKLDPKYKMDENGWVILGKADPAKAEIAAIKAFNRKSPGNAPMVVDPNEPLGEGTLLLVEDDAY